MEQKRGLETFICELRIERRTLRGSVAMGHAMCVRVQSIVHFALQRTKFERICKGMQLWQVGRIVVRLTRQLAKREGIRDLIG
jgi:hypothetical protein